MEIPNILNDANVYVDGANWLGKASVELPEVSHKVVDVNAFGIAGGMETPLIGHIDKLSGNIKFKSMTPDAAKVLYNASHAPILDIRAAVQSYNVQTGNMDVYPVKVTMRAFFKKVKLGDFKQGTDAESQADYEAHYYKLEINGEEILEIDKFSYIYKVNGKDLLASVRETLGM
ncbi:MAG: phage major tail tube protein [Nitrospinae bacterium]|nr:phage major tail tube protein [Nitrospinota bacterium]